MSETISSVSTTSEATERILGFSDAVFAIAITFLALDLGQLPSNLGEGLTVGDFLHEHLPDYLVYAATFLIVGFLWFRHHLIYRYIKLRSPALVWLNIALLALVASLPYPAGLVSDAFGFGLAMCILVGPLWLISMLLLLQWVHACDSRLVIPDLDSTTRRYLLSQLISTPVTLGIALVLSLISWAEESETLCFVAAGVCSLIFILPVVFARIWPPPHGASEFDPVNRKDHPEFEEAIPAAEAETESAANARSMLTRIANGSDAVRVKIFTDGVFAIAVTILALQLTPPERGEEIITTDSIIENLETIPWWPFVMTFFLISIFWVSHVHIFERVVGVDSTLIWLNLILLLFVAFMPLPVEVLQTTKNDLDAQVLYLSMLSMISVSLVSISIYASLGKRIAVPRGGKSFEKAQIFRSIWLCAAFVIPTVLVAVTGDIWFSYGIIVLFLLRGIVFRRFYPELAADKFD